VIHDQHVPPYVQKLVVTTSRALAGLGLIERELEPGERVRRRREAATREPAGCPVDWARWVKRWAETSTLTPSTRRGIVNNLLQVGRWVAVAYPEVTTPEQWTRELAATYVAAVDRATVGEWARAAFFPADRIGQPLKPQAKHTRLRAIRPTHRATGRVQRFWGR
jgi:hypothetical protein